MQQTFPPGLIVETAHPGKASVSFFDNSLNHN